MRCLYINLDDAEARRIALEANFAQLAPPDWTLRRFPAVSAAEVPLPGPIQAAERACFCSHRAALASALDDDEHVLILEDDVVFSPRAFSAIGEAVDADGWDLIYTDVAVGDAASIVRLARLRPALIAAGAFELIDLSRMVYAGTAAYVVHSARKRWLAEQLNAVAELHAPYDLVLRELVRHGRLRARVVFPFVTSPSPLAESSQIQADAGRLAELVYIGFRQLMYVDRDLDAVRRTASLVREQIAEEEDARLAGELFSAIVSPKFPTK